MCVVCGGVSVNWDILGHELFYNSELIITSFTIVMRNCLSVMPFVDVLSPQNLLLGF